MFLNQDFIRTSRDFIKGTTKTFNKAINVFKKPCGSATSIENRKQQLH